MPRTARIALFSAALAALLASFAAPGARAQALPGFALGFNQAWFAGDYGHDLARSFDPIAADILFGKMAQAGARVVRMWAFEGEEKEALVFEASTRVRGLFPGFLDNVETVCDLARRHGLEVYWTLFDGNWHWARGTHASHVHFNILNNKYGEGDSFNYRALAPFLERLARHRDVIFALDLMNEVQGSVATWYWPDGWTGARRWIARTCAFAKARAPWLRVTASAGWHTGPADLASGLFSGLGLDFYDLHVYDDQGRIPNAFALRLLSWSTGRQIVLGEFGQATAREDDLLQHAVTARFIANARALRFAGALGWRFDDERPWNPQWVPYHSYLRGGRPRPAVQAVRDAAAQVGAASPWWW